MALVDPNVPVAVIHPGTGQSIVLPAFAAAQFPQLQLASQPQNDIYLQGPRGSTDDGSVGAPPPPPPPPPTSGGSKGPQKKMIGTGEAQGDEVAATPQAPISGTDALAQPSLAPMLAQPQVTPPPAAVQPGIGVPQTAMDQAAQAVPNAPAPPAPPVIANDLRAGFAKPLNEFNTAIGEAKKAGEQQAQAEAAQSRAEADAYAAEQQRQDQIDQQRAQAAQAKLNEINQKYAQIGSAIDNVSKMRVDQSIAHPTMAAIGVALGALGAALQHSNTNVALDVLNQQIARNTQVQMENINNARAAIGMQQGQLANLRSQFTDQNALYDAMSSAETRRAQNMINQIAARSNSDIVKAKAQALSAQLDQQAAQQHASAVQQQVETDQRQTGLALQKRGQDISAYEQGQNRAQAADQFNKDLDFRKKQEADEMKARADALKQSGDLASAKMLLDKAQQFQTGGVMQPTTLAPDATGTYHPAGFKPLLQEDGTIYIAPKGREKDVQEFNTYANQALQAIDNVRALRQKNGGNLANTAEARQAVQELARALMAEQNMSGTKRWSTELADIMQKKLTGGADINSVIRDVLPNLDQARADLIQDRNTYMRGANYTGPDIPAPDPLKMPRASVSDESMLKTAPEVPQPNATDFNKTLLSLRDAEQMLYSGDPAKQQTALKVLHDPSIKDRKTKEVVRDILNNYMTAGATGKPLLPDPNTNPAYYQDK
jgi:hypothetical protein